MQAQAELRDEDVRARTMKEILDSVEASLRAEIATDFPSAPIFECLNKIRLGEYAFVMSPKEYNEGLAMQLEHSVTKHQLAQKALGTLRNSVLMEEVVINRMSDMLEAEASQVINTQHATIGRLTMELLDSRKENDDLRQKQTKAAIGLPQLSSEIPLFLFSENINLRHFMLALV
jgi:hypothetical protein